jgi:hypothetical protein
MSGTNLKLDIQAFNAGIRTAGALLIGNSVLVVTGVIGNVSSPFVVATVVFTIGAMILIIASLQRSTP